MPQAKKPPRCTKPAGHDSTYDALVAELERVNAKLADVYLERGPSCKHSPGSADDRNIRLMADKAAVAQLLAVERERVKVLEVENTRLSSQARRASRASEAKSRRNAGKVASPESQRQRPDAPQEPIGIGW